MSTFVDIVRIAFFAYAAWLTFQLMQQVSAASAWPSSTPDRPDVQRRARRLRADDMASARRRSRQLDPRRLGARAARADRLASGRRGRSGPVSPGAFKLLFLALMGTGIPVAIAMAGSSLIYVMVDGQRAGLRRHPPHGGRHRLFPAARGAVLHPRRQPDEFRRHHQPHLQLRAGAGGLAARRPWTRQRRGLGDLRRHVGHGDRRCGGPGHDRDQGDARPRLQRPSSQWASPPLRPRSGRSSRPRCRS